MIDLSEFEFDKVPVPEARALVPAGEYTATVVNSEKKQTNSGDGSYLRLDFEIVDGQYGGAKLSEFYNLWNNNEGTVRIAKETMAKLMRAAGREGLSSAAQLYGIPLIIVVKIGPHWKTNEPTSMIKGYKSVAKAPLVAPKADEQEKGDDVPW